MYVIQIILFQKKINSIKKHMLYNIIEIEIKKNMNEIKAGGWKGLVFRLNIKP